MIERKSSYVIITITLSIGLVFLILPFIWMLLTSIKTLTEATTFSWLPNSIFTENFTEAWNKVDFPLYFLNSIIVSLIVMVGVVITSSFAAYALARIEFAGREALFLVILGMMMVPQPVYLVPSYIILDKLGWYDTYAALTIPWVANIFSIFLLRQHFKSIPKELYEAAILDGVSEFGFLWRIVVPLSKSVLVTVGIFSIIGSWNSFMWPLIMTQSPEMRTLQVGLSYFSNSFGGDPTLQMAAATFSIIPLIVLFFIAQKKIIASYSRSGLKS